jgi:hypothetical protein
VDLHAVVREGGEEYCRAGVPAQAVFGTTYREEQQNELTLVREDSMPVGSGRVFMHFSSNYRTSVLTLEFLRSEYTHLSLSIHTRFSAMPDRSVFASVSLFARLCHLSGL